MGALMRAHDWSATPLGPAANWSQPLRSAVGIMLGATSPMGIYWGADLALFYNDAGRELIGDKHPQALGRPAREVFLEIWDTIGPVFAGVMAGAGGNAAREQLLPLDRCGRVEDAWFDYSFSPIPLQDGTVGGVLNLAFETTARVRAERVLRASEARQAFLLALGDRLRDLTDPREVMQAAAGLLGRHLSADRAGYAEVEDAGEFFTVERDWCAPGMPSLAGRHRLDDFGPALIAEFRAGRSVAFEDALAEPLTPGGGAAVAYHRASTRAAITVPLVKAGHFAAALYVHAREPRRWTGEDEALVREAAERTGAAVERARAETALREREERQALLLRLVRGQRETSDPDAMMLAVSEAVGCHLGANRVGFFDMLDDETLSFTVGWTDGSLDLLTGTFPAEGIGSAYLAAVRQGTVLGIADVQQDPLTAGSIFAEIGARAIIGVPIIRNGRWHAGMYVNYAAVRHWTEEEVSLVRDVADQTWDAVERARAEAALRELNETLEARVTARTAERNRLWSMTNLLVAVAAFDSTIREVNPAWPVLLGWSEAELVGRSYAEFVYPDDVERSLAWAAKLAGGEEVVDLVNRYRCKDGSYRWIAWAITADDSVFHCVGRDVTDQKQQADALAAAEEALRQAQKMEAVGQLTGGIAHDFNNMLQSIAGSLDMMRRRMEQGRTAEVGRYVDAARQAVERAGTLAHRLLAFARRQTLQSDPVEPNALISGMEDLIRRTVGPAITVELRLDDNAWSVLSDPNQIENVLLNLVINARDAMPEGGRLTIGTARKALGAADVRQPGRGEAGRLRGDLRGRHRHGHGRSHPGARLRAVLHDQAAWARDGAGPVPALRLRAAVERRGAPRQRAGPGHGRVALPAAAGLRSGAGDVFGTRGGIGRGRRGRDSAAGRRRGSCARHDGRAPARAGLRGAGGEERACGIVPVALRHARGDHPPLRWTRVTAYAAAASCSLLVGVM